MVEVAQALIWGPIWKIKKAQRQKKAGGMDHVVECLPSKYKALCSYQIIIKEKKV
jgi:hypothetical protein